MHCRKFIHLTNLSSSVRPQKRWMQSGRIFSCVIVLPSDFHLKELAKDWWRYGCSNQCPIYTEEMRLGGANMDNTVQLVNGNYIWMTRVYHNLHCIGSRQITRDWSNDWKKQTNAIRWYIWGGVALSKHNRIVKTSQQRASQWVKPMISIARNQTLTMRSKVEILRTSLMCQADLSMYSSEWFKTEQGELESRDTSIAERVCVDWDAIYNWGLKENRILGSHRYVLPPKTSSLVAWWILHRTCLYYESWIILGAGGMVLVRCTKGSCLDMFCSFWGDIEGSLLRYLALDGIINEGRAKLCSNTLRSDQSLSGLWYLSDVMGDMWKMVYLDVTAFLL